jgi:hypothetical protein
VNTANPSGGPDPAGPDPTTAQAVNVQKGGRVTDQATRVVAAGWYEDPSSAAHVRWWNGVAWTDHTREKPATSPQAITTTPDFGADQVRELERQFLYGGDAAAQAAAEITPEGTRGRRPRRSIEADRARIYGAHTSTGSVWLIALSPLLVIVVAIAVGYFYSYVDPQPLVLAVGALPVLLGLLWAITDARKLRDWGNDAASGLWALLGPLVYLIARRIKVKGSGPLATFVVVAALAIAAPTTAYALELTKPITAALAIQSTVRADYVGSGQATSVTCSPFAEATTVGAIYTCDATMADGRTRQVIVSIDSSDGDFSYAFALN